MLSPVEEIKARIDIVELVQSYVKLQKAGVNFKANCPFHSERTPSFFVTPSRQIWHCFGSCGEGGDIFKFIMKIEGLEFPEALKLLAQRAGVALKREDPAIRSERNRLYDICALATEIFERAFSLTPAVKSYMRERGVSDETIQAFRIGYAPDSWDFLLKNLTQRKFLAQDIEKAGLAIKSSDGSGRHYDRFRSRIIFPIMDANSRVIGFSGRIFAQETKEKRQEARVEAKYINTPQTLIYDKSRALYGFDKAKQEIRSKNQVVIVEGQMDCVMSHQAGVKNTIAVSGTALTSQQLKQLKNLCNAVVATFDKDSAGDLATSRSLTMMAGDFERYVAIVPTGKDVADLVAEDPELWQKTAKNKQEFIEFFMIRAFEKFDAQTSDGRKKVLDLVLPELRRVTNPVSVSDQTKILARRLNVKEELIWESLNRLENLDLKGEGLEIPRAAPGKNRRELLEERYLSLLSTLNEEERLREAENQDMVFTLPEHQQLFQVLTIPASANTPATEMLRFKSEIISHGISAKNPKEEFLLCRLELRKSWLKERLQQLTVDIQRTEKTGDRAIVMSLLQDFRTVSETLKSLSV